MIKIYGDAECEFSQEVVSKCIELDMEYEYIETLMDQESINLFFINKFKTIPQIFMMGEHLGGYDEFMAYLPNK